MEVQFKKHVRVICDLAVGDKVMTDNWGPALDGKQFEVAEISPHIGKCKSGFMARLVGHPTFIDVQWLNKV